MAGGAPWDFRRFAFVTASARSSTSDLKPRRARSESGQAIVIVIAALMVLLSITGLVIDFGSAFYASRHLQASADAAALAGAQELPDTNLAIQVAKDYSGGRGKKNDAIRLDEAKVTVFAKCITSAPGCAPNNAIQVEQVMHHKTAFLKILGLNEIVLHTKSVACSPCESKPLDIMLVLDRTGSMCEDHNGNSDPACTDLNNARNGLKTFLSFFDSKSQYIGFAVFPPGTSCGTPDTNDYNSTTSPYVLVPLSSDYKLPGGGLNNNSNLIKTINCQKGGGRTAYATALEKAQAELDAHGRPNVKDIIVFMSDGAANIGPTYYSTKSPYRMQPCHQGVTSANAIKARGTEIYSIGYDLNALNGGANKCQDYNSNDEKPAITAYQAIQQIATDTGNFYNQPNPGQLNTIFTKVAADIAHGASKLVDVDVK